MTKIGPLSRAVFAPLAVVVALSAILPAHAAIYLATYTGTMTGTSFDVTGLFGTAQTSLNGLAYTAVYRIDDGLAGAVPYVGVLDQYTTGSYVAGGFNFGTTVLPVSASLTINGITQGFIGTASSIAKEARYNNADSIIDYVNGVRGSINLDIFTYPDQPLATGDFRDLLEYDVPSYAAANSSGSFSIYQNDTAAYDWAFGAFSIAHFSLTAGPSDVPEPATWALMLVGVAFIAAIRRRSIGR